MRQDLPGAPVEDTAQLMRKIEGANLRLKVISVFLLIILVTFLVVMLTQIYSLQLDNKRLLDSQAALLKQERVSFDTQQSYDNKRLETLTQYIRCIADFFNQPDRTSKLLTSLDQCHIEQAASNSTQAPVTSKSVSPSNNSQSSKAANTTNSSPPAPASRPAPTKPQPQPVTAFGLQLCIPLTKTCFSH